ncbi:uncharacterized protein LOC125654929 [Ostrea edulis]|uniref:uncharacterized protein LOC125654929 n=1 Tax=Ostrea edulis TaxID=37623 RepID=UPI0024AF3710|nr:uncharacterized protein LOC125654929 [Ostrea edulis]
MSTCLVPYPRFGDWPGQIVEIMPGHQLRVALFPSLEETIVCQRDVIKDLPAKAPKTWKKGSLYVLNIRLIEIFLQAAAAKVQTSSSKKGKAAAAKVQSKDVGSGPKASTSKKRKAAAAKVQFKDVGSGPKASTSKKRKAAAAKVQSKDVGTGPKTSTSKKRKAEESKDLGSRPKASSSKAVNKQKGQDQRRTTASRFGLKNFIDCSWRTLLKKMYLEHSGVTCICTCNGRPISSAQALIKHIERNHYVGDCVVLGEEDISIVPPPQ